MTPITIGPGAVDRSSQGAPNWTQVSKTNPAAEAGIIDTVEIWGAADMTGVVVASFYVVSGNNLSTRDYVNIGDVPAGSKQVFTGLSLQVQPGDYIGMYCVAGTIETGAPAGGGRWYKPGNYIPCANAAFTYTAFTDYSLYGSGSSGGGAVIHPVWRSRGVGIGVGLAHGA
jgi:hypothetical protein